MHEALRHIFSRPYLAWEHFAGQKFLQQHRDLQLRQTRADSAVDAKAERQEPFGISACDIKGFCIREYALIAVAADLPDDDLVDFFHRYTGDIGIGHRRATHMGEQGLAAQDFRNYIENQIVMASSLAHSPS